MRLRQSTARLSLQTETSPWEGDALRSATEPSGLFRDLPTTSRALSLTVPRHCPYPAGSGIC